jgi:hypothetical protein
MGTTHFPHCRIPRHAVFLSYTRMGHFYTVCHGCVAVLWDDAELGCVDFYF